jgi:hypothetical protein
MEVIMSITVTVLAGYFAFALVAPVAEAANRFAMTCIENKTDITLNYRKKWGKNDSWDSHRLEPGKRISHTKELTSDGKAPDLYVTFDDDLSGRTKKRDYVLVSFASPQTTDCKNYGKEYHFRYDGTAKKFIDLVGIR